MNYTVSSTREERIVWLLAHQELWRGYGEASGNHAPKKFGLIVAMQKDGLFSKKNLQNWRTFSILSLINEARARRRHNAVKRVR